MAKVKPVSTRSAAQLAKALGLPASAAREWEVQASLLAHLQSIVAKTPITHGELAKLAGSSRTRVTSILNGNLESVSTDLLIRLLGALGYEVSVSVTRSSKAA